MIKAKCKITKQVYKNNDYRVFGCQPLENHKDFVLNKYGSITITGDLSYLEEGQEYVMCLEKSDQKYNNQVQYNVVRVPSLEVDIDNITPEKDKELLKQITTPSLVEEIHKIYPNYCQMILSGNDKDIDLKKIKGVKDFRHNAHVRKLNEKYKYYHLQSLHKHYELTVDDCRDLFKMYDDIDIINKSLEKNPYFCLINVCHKPFHIVDRLILDYNKELIDSDIRCEYFMIYLLKQNELQGNTYMNAVEMSRGLDRYVLPKSKDVAIKSDMIYFDEKTNDIALMSTYMAEWNIADFVTNRVKHPIKLDWDWSKFNKTKDGELTEEQQNVLKEFCENNFLILDSCAGSGKSTSMLALVQMCEHYGATYKLFAPTGKASKRLAESTNREASTIHKGTALGLANLEQDVIIIDEASMLNLETFTMIINCISNPDARILLLLDIEQLPPIGLGCIARELSNSGVVPICTLTKVFRFSSGGMIKSTTLARKGEWYLDELGDEDSIILGKEQDYEFIKSDHTTEQIVNKYIEYIDNGVNVEDVVVLTPRNTGEYGTYNLNNLIQEKINPIKDDKFFERTISNTKIKFHKNDLVLVTKNNYNMMNYQAYDEMYFDDDLQKADMPKTNVFNGEIGTIVGFTEDAMKVLINDEIVMFFKADITNLLLGYSTTIYKFQGSQIKYPIILTSNAHKNQLSKNLLYTNLSRGQKKVVEIGDVDAIRYALCHKALDNKKNKIAKIMKEEYNDIGTK